MKKMYCDIMYKLTVSLISYYVHICNGQPTVPLLKEEERKKMQEEEEDRRRSSSSSSSVNGRRRGKQNA